jgi:hypothetical protein
LKLHGTHQLLVYADNVNVSSGSVPTTKKNTEPVVVASKEAGLEVNAEKPKYMVMGSIKCGEFLDYITVNTGNTSFERVES